MLTGNASHPSVFCAHALPTTSYTMIVALGTAQTKVSQNQQHRRFDAMPIATLEKPKAPDQGILCAVACCSLFLLTHAPLL